MSQPTGGLASEKEARDVAEAARESEWSGPSFVRELFLGRFRLDLIHPHPVEDPNEAARAQPFFDRLSDFLRRVDSDMIDRTGEIPEEYVQELRDMGAFGIKIPTEYGGLGLSYTSYVKAMAMVTSKDGSLTALLSAHQSIGLPQPLKLFGSDEQKKKYFPRLAKGAISAFALTEVDAGSDPANMHAMMQLASRPTSDFTYLRLMGQDQSIVDYSRIQIDRTRELEGWTETLWPYAEQGREAFVYVNNHFAGHSPQSARELQRLLGQQSTEPEQIGEQISLF